MKKPLCDVLFASEKRKQALLSLKNGSKEMEHILNALDTTRTALLPQMKVLEEHHLVSHNRDTYELTPIGKLIVDEMKPLVDKIEIFDTDNDYWGTHDLSFIPFHLLEKIKNVNCCKIINPSMHELFQLNADYIDKTCNSEFLSTITTTLHPKFREIYLSLIECGVTISLIISNELFQKIKTGMYNDLSQLVNQKKINIFVYNKPMNVFAFSVNNYSLIFRLLTTNGEYDNRQLILDGEEAIKWGKDIFDYYLKDSTRITEV